MSDKDYRILFAGEEIPAYEAWGKLKVAQTALGVLERFNRNRRTLATDLTRETEEAVRCHLAELEVLLPKALEKTPALEEIARALLLEHTPEETVALLRRDHQVECDLQGLVHLAGSESYRHSLALEGAVLTNNSISPDQIAVLWNEAGRPAPGKPLWDRLLVVEVLQGRD